MYRQVYCMIIKHQLRDIHIRPVSLPLTLCHFIEENLDKLWPLPFWRKLPLLKWGEQWKRHRIYWCLKWSGPWLQCNLFSIIRKQCSVVLHYIKCKVRKSFIVVKLLLQYLIILLFPEFLRSWSSKKKERINTHNWQQI